jgi:hypothetical protein
MTSTPRPPRRPFQFNLRTLFGLTLLCSLAMAAGAGIMRAGASGNDRQLMIYVVLAVAGPLLVMIVASLVLPAMRVWRRWRR